MKKIFFLAAIMLLAFSSFSQDGGQMFTFNFGHKHFDNQPNNSHNSVGLEYDVAGKHIGLALRSNFLLRGGDPHVGVGASGKVYYGRKAPAGFYNGFGVDILLLDGSQIMTRGDFGYNLVISNFAMGFEFVAGYDHGYGHSIGGTSTSYFGGLLLGGELKVGWAF